MLNRRRLLQGSTALAFAGLARSALAQDESVPIVFVHGDSDLAATWETQIWRFESNGYPRDRLFAISFTDPQARDDDTVAPGQPLFDCRPDPRTDGVYRRRQGQDWHGQGSDRRAVARRLRDT
jgi:Lipase (class 2)